jgi:hypothetical protein
MSDTAAGTTTTGGTSGLVQVVNGTTQQPDTSPQPAADATPAPPASFDEWMATQDEPVKKLITTRFTALESTVRATRDERDEIKKQLKDLLPKVEKGSELEKSLVDMSAKFEQAERRAAFLEDAMRPEIQCRNPRAAWTLANTLNLFDKRDRPDWQAIKAEAPELFGVISANANAGAGTGKPVPASKNMNNFIRAAAGRT